MHPGEPNAWDELGLAFLGNAQPDSAEAAYRRALKLDPAFWVAKMNLAEVAFSRGDVLEAAVVLEDLWAEFGSKPSSRLATHATHVMGLAFYYGEIGRTGKVRDLCEASLRDKPRLRTVVDYCQLLLSLGEPTEALQQIRAAKQTWDPHQTDTLLLQEGMAYVRLDSLPQARAVVEQVRELYETYGENQFSYHYLAANLALAENRSHVALRLLQEAMAYGIHFPGPRDIALRDSYARALREAGQVANAVVVLQETLRLYGGHALGHYELGQIYEEMGRTTAAVQEYSTFLDMWSEADEALPQVADARQSVADLR
jgi:predicted Zn-dependent protease